MRLDMLAFDKLFASFWGPLMSRFENQEKIDAFKVNLPKMEEFFKKNLNGADFLSGTNEPMMIDMHCYPMVERMVMLEKSPWKNGFEAIGMNDAPAICAYVHRFRAHPKLAPHVITQDAYNKLIGQDDEVSEDEDVKGFVERRLSMNITNI